MDNGRWRDIYMHLQSKGVDVYSPAQHVGECKSKYVVLKDAGLTKMASFSTTMQMYEVLCYVPAGQFSQVESYKETIKSYMAELKRNFMIRETYVETPSFFDEDINGHMVSVQYVVYKQIM